MTAPKTKEDLLQNFAAPETAFSKEILHCHSSVLLAMDAYAKQQALLFSKFKEYYQKEELMKVKKERERVGGIFSWMRASDGKIYEQFISESEKIEP